MCFWGYRFEQYATVPYNSDGTNDGSGDGNGGGASGAGDGSKYADYDAPIVNSNKQYCSVVRLKCAISLFGLFPPSNVKHILLIPSCIN